MRGYRFIEQRYLIPHKEDGIPPYETKISFLDFLRELKSGSENIPEHTSYMVTGLDEVLYGTQAGKRKDIALSIHRVLQTAAGDLHRRFIQVQIITRGKLFKADSFWMEYRGEKLILDTIFGTPLKQIIHGCDIYEVGFNLSS